MAKRIFVVLVAIFLVMSIGSLAIAKKNVPEKKRTKLGKYVTVAEAYEMWKTVV
jgi:hypothetical protein